MKHTIIRQGSACFRDKSRAEQNDNGDNGNDKEKQYLFMGEVKRDRELNNETAKKIIGRSSRQVVCKSTASKPARAKKKRKHL